MRHTVANLYFKLIDCLLSYMALKIIEIENFQISI